MIPKDDTDFKSSVDPIFEQMPMVQAGHKIKSEIN